MPEITDIAPSAQSKEEAENADHLWRFLVYGNPGVGKTHFACSMPGPVMFIDTEGKGNAIFDKFDKEIVYWSPENYDELTNALAEAIDTLDSIFAGDVDGLEAGTRGTIVVDSMALCWDWAQQKYVSMAYPGKSVDDIEFQSALQGGRESDCEGDQGRPMGNLKKSALTKIKFGRMAWPDFPKVSGAIDTLHDAETSDDEVHLDDLERELNVDLFTGDPDIVYRQGAE